MIVRDEARRIGDALASVAFCDEIIVVDSGSTDATVDIAERAGATVVHQPWLGFAKQRNVAIDSACMEWVLEVDADERVSPELRDEILSFLEDPECFELAAFPSRTEFLGRRLGPSASFPEYRHRLFRRGSLRHDEDRPVHEGVDAATPAYPLAGELEHLLASSIGEAVEDWWRYARLHSGTVAPPPLVDLPRTVVLRPLAKLIYRSVILGGWRDGWQGWVKLGFDCSSDSLVWLFAAARGPVRFSGGRAPHFAYERPHAGPVHLVGIASGPVETESAERWLSDARCDGADVSLLTDQVGIGRVRSRRLCRLSYFEAARAIEAEDQLRPIDGLVVWGRRAKWIASFLPASRRGASHVIDAALSPSSVIAEVTARSRTVPDASGYPIEEA